jgi:hypothetical protein
MSERAFCGLLGRFAEVRELGEIDTVLRARAFASCPADRR